LAFSPTELDKLSRAATILQAAKKKLPVMRTLSWDRALSDAFFANGEKIPPHPTYPTIDTSKTTQALDEARALIEGSSPVHAWLHRVTSNIEQTAAMLSSLGTSAFYDHSLALYGGPSSPITDGQGTALALAKRLDLMLSEFDDSSINLDHQEKLSASELKDRLDEKLPNYFADQVPRVEIAANLSAKAVAGRNYIKLRADADFSDLDVTQLLQHEALIHVATGFNGAAQSHFPLLGSSRPGVTRTQEGLAVFAEFISGALDPTRFKRLADRVIAIQMSANGANFIELYNFFRDQSKNDAPYEAFESARRIVRGGLVEGGAPFTKDSVYLGGLLEIHNYLRTAVKTGDAKFIRLLFVGKIDLADLAAMKMLDEDGLLTPPRFMPPWATDLRYLLSYLAYSTFLNGINLDKVADRYDNLLGLNKNNSS